MEVLETGGNTREVIKDKLRVNFDGKIVRKDLTKKIKEGANVPVYVLEFLLGQYCSSDDEEVIEREFKVSSVFWRIILFGQMRLRRFSPNCAAMAAIPSLI